MDLMSLLPMLNNLSPLLQNFNFQNNSQPNANSVNQNIIKKPENVNKISVSSLGYPEYLIDGNLNNFQDNSSNNNPQLNKTNFEKSQQQNNFSNQQNKNNFNKNFVQDNNNLTNNNNFQDGNIIQNLMGLLNNSNSNPLNLILNLMSNFTSKDNKNNANLLNSLFNKTEEKTHSTMQNFDKKDENNKINTYKKIKDFIAVCDIDF